MNFNSTEEIKLRQILLKYYFICGKVAILKVFILYIYQWGVAIFQKNKQPKAYIVDNKKKKERVKVHYSEFREQELDLPRESKINDSNFSYVI